MEHGYKIKKINTKRLVLKKGNEEDYLNVYEYDFTKLKYMNEMIEYVKQNPRNIKKWFKKGIDNFYLECKLNHMFDWIIFYKNEAIGNILAEENIDDKNIEIMVNIHPNFWNKGYATEAIDNVVDYLISIGYTDIIIRYIDGDVKVKHITEKLGFKPYNIKKDAIKIENSLYDEYYVLMKKEDWLSKTGKIKL